VRCGGDPGAAFCQPGSGRLLVAAHHRDGAEFWCVVVGSGFRLRVIIDPENFSGWLGTVRNAFQVGEKQNSDWIFDVGIYPVPAIGKPGTAALADPVGSNFVALFETSVAFIFRGPANDGDF